MKTHVLMFQDRFAELVRAGTKRQTIRPVRKREIHEGDLLDLRQWSGKPYRSPQKALLPLLQECKSVEPISIRRHREGTWELWTDRPLTIVEASELAERDGFYAACDFLHWFANTHGLPFLGVLIKW